MPSPFVVSTRRKSLPQNIFSCIRPFPPNEKLIGSGDMTVLPLAILGKGQGNSCRRARLAESGFTTVRGGTAMELTFFLRREPVVGP